MGPATPDVTAGSVPPAAAPPARPAHGDVEAAALAELAALGVDRATSALAATSLELARQLDNPRNSATAKSMCAARLIESLDRLRELNPPAQEDSPLDQIAARRRERIAAATG